MNVAILPYDPGILPTKSAPKPGEKIVIELPGLPPFKDVSRSIRNRKHPRYDAFVALRRKAIEAMEGRAWYFGPVCLELVVYAPKLHEGRSIIDYIAGVEDTLDGSSGCTFTYLPIMFEDDCQVAIGPSRFVESEEAKYQLKITFF